MPTRSRSIRLWKTEMKFDDEYYMREALKLAEIAAAEGETPVGAVVVRKSDGEIVGRGYNRRETAKSPLAHAELIALDEASRTLGGWRIIGCELYVTLEPCPMCAGAIINSRIERIVYGASDEKAGSVESRVRLFDLGYNHTPEITSGVLKDESAALLSEFFRKLRQSKKK